MKKKLIITEQQLKRLSEQLDTEPQLGQSDLDSLKKINQTIPWNEVLDWFNKNKIDHSHLHDIDMYIMYIEYLKENYGE